MSSDGNEYQYEMSRKKKKTAYRQKYCIDWEKEKCFKGWLAKSKKGTYVSFYTFNELEVNINNFIILCTYLSLSLGENYFQCIACGFDGVAGKSEIRKHASGQKHKRLVEGCKNQRSLTSLQSISKHTQLDTSVFP